MVCIYYTQLNRCNEVNNLATLHYVDIFNTIYVTLVSYISANKIVNHSVVFDAALQQFGNSLIVFVVICKGIDLFAIIQIHYKVVTFGDFVSIWWDLSPLIYLCTDLESSQSFEMYTVSLKKSYSIIFHQTY